MLRVYATTLVCKSGKKINCHEALNDVFELKLKV